MLNHYCYLNLLFYGIPLFHSIPLSLRLYSLTHTLCLFFTLTLSIYISTYIYIYLPLTLRPPLFLFPSMFLLFSIAVLQRMNLFFIIYLSCFVCFISLFLDNFIYFVCQHAHEPASSAAAYPYPIASAPIYAANGTEMTSTENRKRII